MCLKIVLNVVYPGILNSEIIVSIFKHKDEKILRPQFPEGQFFLWRQWPIGEAGKTAPDACDNFGMFGFEFVFFKCQLPINVCHWFNR